VVVKICNPTLGRLRQEDCEIEASPGFTVRPYLKKVLIIKKNNFNIKIRPNKHHMYVR
jgi:hypothetical protein